MQVGFGLIKVFFEANLIFRPDGHLNLKIIIITNSAPKRSNKIPGN